MHKFSLLCATAILGAAVFTSTEASARGGHHGGGHHGGWHHSGHHGGWHHGGWHWHHGGWHGGWHHGGWHHGWYGGGWHRGWHGGYGYGYAHADGFLAPTRGIGSGVAGDRLSGPASPARLTGPNSTS